MTTSTCVLLLFPIGAFDSVHDSVLKKVASVTEEILRKIHLSVRSKWQTCDMRVPGLARTLVEFRWPHRRTFLSILSWAAGCASHKNIFFGILSVKTTWELVHFYFNSAWRVSFHAKSRLHQKAERRWERALCGTTPQEEEHSARSHRRSGNSLRYCTLPPGRRPLSLWNKDNFI
jgi:hypothetical protein